MVKYFLAISFLLSGCLTPDNWKPEDHEKMMMRCRIMCGKGRAASYNSWDAECTCCEKLTK